MNFFNVTLPLALVNVINQASRSLMALIGPLLALEFGQIGRAHV